MSDIQIRVAGKRLAINKYRADFERDSGHIKLPTPRQLKFVKLLFEGKGMIPAYHGAGYAHKGKPRNNWFQAQLVLKSDGVQILIGVILRDYINARQLSVSAIIEKAFHTYENATTVREQLDTLKFIAKLAGHT